MDMFLDVIDRFGQIFFYIVVEKSMEMVIVLLEVGVLVNIEDNVGIKLYFFVIVLVMIVQILR